jgi:hypothetical protein
MAEFTFDLDSLTIEEIEFVEDYTGYAIDEIQQPGVKKGKLLRAFAYVQERRTNPSFSLEDAGKLNVSGEQKHNPLGEAKEESSESEDSLTLPKGQDWESAILRSSPSKS